MGAAVQRINGVGMWQIINGSIGQSRWRLTMDGMCPWDDIRQAALMRHVVVLVYRLVMPIGEHRESTAFGLHRERAGSSLSSG